MIKQKDVLQIAEDIQNIVDQGTSYLDALVHYSEKTGMEIEVLADVVKKSSFLTSKLLDEAEELHLVEKSRRFTT